MSICPHSLACPNRNPPREQGWVVVVTRLLGNSLLVLTTTLFTDSPWLNVGANTARGAALRGRYECRKAVGSTCKPEFPRQSC